MDVHDVDENISVRVVKLLPNARPFDTAFINQKYVKEKGIVVGKAEEFGLGVFAVRHTDHERHINVALYFRENLAVANKTVGDIKSGDKVWIASLPNRTFNVDSISPKYVGLTGTIIGRAREFGLQVFAVKHVDNEGCVNVGFYHLEELEEVKPTK